MLMEVNILINPTLAGPTLCKDRLCKVFTSFRPLAFCLSLCFTTIISSNPHGLQRTYICTAYKHTYRQLQVEIDGLCQFLFRENANHSDRSL